LRRNVAERSETGSASRLIAEKKCSYNFILQAMHFLGGIMARLKLKRRYPAGSSF
jgi:hypothetical protein